MGVFFEKKKEKRRKHFYDEKCEKIWGILEENVF